MNNKIIIYFFAKDISSQLLSSINSEFNTHQWVMIDTSPITLSSPIGKNPSNFKSLAYTLIGNLEKLDLLQLALRKLANQLYFDFIISSGDFCLKKCHLMCFDMDSTFIQSEVIDDLAKIYGIEEKVKAITKSAMAGEIDFEESFKNRVSLLKGIGIDILYDIAANLKLSPYVEDLIKVLKSAKCKIAIITGGATFFADYLKEKYKLDYAFGTELELKDGELTGYCIGQIVDAKGKENILKTLAISENIHVNQTIAVGDGANDLLMLQSAGLGIAYHPNQYVKERVRNSLSIFGFDCLLDLLVRN